MPDSIIADEETRNTIRQLAESLPNWLPDIKQVQAGAVRSGNAAMPIVQIVAVDGGIVASMHVDLAVEIARSVLAIAHAFKTASESPQGLVIPSRPEVPRHVH